MFPPTIDNVKALLAAYQIVVQYDVIQKRMHIDFPGLNCPPDNWEATALATITSHASRHGLSTSSIPENLAAIANENAVNPVKEWIDSKEWDGEDRIAAVADTIVAEPDYPDKLKQVLVHRWLLSAAAAALLPSGFKARGVLTLQGRQGIGKTSWGMSLINEPRLRAVALKVDHHLDPHNKDSALGAIRHWIVELGELDSTFRRDIARLKGFLTSDVDKIRLPYGRAEASFQRRTVFFATVNEIQFLVDSTGNTRFWTISVERLNFQHGIDMQQVFAQLAVELQNGAEWWLTAEEEAELEKSNRRHRAASVIRERLEASIDVERSPVAGKNMIALDILSELGFRHPTNTQCREAGAVLRDLLGSPKRINGRDKWKVALFQETGVFGQPVAPIEDDDDRY